MSQPQEQTKKASILDMMSEEHAAKAQARQHQQYEQLSRTVNSEWMMLSELGVYYGWGAVQAFLDDTIGIDQANMLIQGARKVHSGHIYDHSLAHLAATSGNFEKIMKTYIEDMKVER